MTAADKEAAAKRATEAKSSKTPVASSRRVLGVPASVDFEKTLVVSLGSPR